MMLAHICLLFFREKLASNEFHGESNIGGDGRRKVEREYTKKHRSRWDESMESWAIYTECNRRKMHYAVLSAQIGRVDIITQTWSTSFLGKLHLLKKRNKKKSFLFSKRLFFSRLV